MMLCMNLGEGTAGGLVRLGGCTGGCTRGLMGDRDTFVHCCLVSGWWLMGGVSIGVVLVSGLVSWVVLSGVGVGGW